jgi:ribosomal-protein-alanine N-acetyltransferase
MSTNEKSTRERASDRHLSLEPAQRSDARVLAAMCALLIEEGLDSRWGQDAIAREIRDPDAVVLVARKGRECIGFAAMRFDFDRASAHLVLLAVAPQHRRQGVAGQLLGWLEVVARRGGVRNVRLEVRACASAARSFYQKLGYREGTRIPGYYQQREDALRFDKDLTRKAPL